MTNTTRKFQPLMLKLLEIDDFIGQVIGNAYSGSDTYFQIYDYNTLALVYSMPWSEASDAIADFEAWCNAQSAMETYDLAPKNYPHSYKEPA